MRITFNVKSGRILFFAIVVLCIMFEPAYLSYNFPTLHVLYRTMKLAISVLILSVFLLRRVKIDGFLLGVMLFEGLLALSTIINSANLYECFRKGFYVIMLALFMKYAVSIDAKQLLKAFSIVLGLYVHINMISYLLYPDGLYTSALEGYTNCWFLGYDNLALIFIILAQEVALFRILSFKKKLLWWDISVIISGIAFVFMQEIATGILTEAIFFLFALMTKWHRARRLIGKGRLIVIGMFAAFFLIQFFNIQEGGIFTAILLMLGKDITFTGRSWLWEIAWGNIISDGIVLGRGVSSVSEYIQEFGRPWTSQLHCYYLHTLYEGGLLAFVVLFFWLLHSASRFDSQKHRYSSMAFLSGFMAILLMWQVEAYNTITIYFVVALFLLDNAHVFEAAYQGREIPRKINRKVLPRSALNQLVENKSN